MASVETVTVLFTDLVGSTALSMQLGPTAADVLRQEHFAVLRTAVDKTGGREVKNLGDGLMVVFSSAAAAVDCAVSMQQEIEQRNRRAEQQISVRIGIGTGDADCEENDYFGPPVVEASRLCAKAEGGQILCGELVRIMAAGRTGHPFASIGALELKGIPEPVAAFAVGWVPTAAVSIVPLPPRLRGVPPVGYVGRADERAQLQRMFGDSVGGQCQIALVAGEPGIGKTRIATWAALEAHGEGATVLYGRCDEDLGIPYQAWVEALGDFIDVAPEDLLGIHVERHGGELARLAPALERRLPGLPPPRASDPETERYLLYGAVTGLLADCSLEAPIVLILDDLHWADAQTLGLLRHLATSGASMRVLVIGVYRDSDIARGDALSKALADLRREDCVSRIALTGLDEKDVVAMMEGASGQEMSGEGLDLARALTRETGGNPFFVAELIRHLYESGGIVATEGRWGLTKSVAELGLPESVREVIGRRIDRLGEESRRTLSIASVIGRDFDFDLLLRISDRGEDQLLDLLDEAVSASVLLESTQSGRFTFAHALINHTLYEDMGPTRRARLHRRIAEAMEEVSGNDPGALLGQLAYHWAQATTPAYAEKAITYAQRAGERALTQLAPDEALRWFNQSLELLENEANPDAALRCDLLIGLGDARRQIGSAEYRDTLIEAAQLALAEADRDRLVRAVLANNRGRTSGTGRVDGDRVALVEAALERTAGEETADRARLLSLLALELVFDSHYDRRRALSDEALQLARRVGDDRALAQVLRDRAYALWAPGSIAEREASVTELIELAERLGDPVMRFWAAFNDVDVRMEQGDIEGTRRQVQQCRAIAEQLRQPTLLWATLFHETCIALAVEDLGTAEELSSQTVQAGQASGEPDALIHFAAQWGLVLIEKARWDECIDPGEKAARGFPGLPAFHASLGIQYLDAERPSDARRVLDEALARGFQSIAGTPITLTAYALYAETAARLGDTETAAEIDELLAPVTEKVVWNGGVNTFNATDYYKGMLAAALGRNEEAESRFSEAIALNLRMGAGRWCIRPRLAWAEMLTKRDGPGDSARARELFGLALEGAVKFGCPALVGRSEAGLTITGSDRTGSRQ